MCLIKRTHTKKKHPILLLPMVMEVSMWFAILTTCTRTLIAFFYRHGHSLNGYIGLALVKESFSNLISAQLATCYKISQTPEKYNLIDLWGSGGIAGLLIHAGLSSGSFFSSIPLKSHRILEICSVILIPKKRNWSSENQNKSVPKTGLLAPRLVDHL